MIKIADAYTRSVVAIGKESVGKSQLLASLSGRPAEATNFRGSTVDCEEYPCGDRVLIDTPGILRQSDAVSTRMALDRLAEVETVLIVAQATHLDDDLADLLPLAAGKQAAIAVTFWDKVNPVGTAKHALDRLREETGLPVIALDARRLLLAQRDEVLTAIDRAATVSETPLRWRGGWRIEPRPGAFERAWLGPLLALVLLFAPAVAAVEMANRFAGWADPILREWLAAPVVAIGAWPEALDVLKALLAGDYGLLTMGPLLFVWAAPTVVLYAFLLGAYKASGLVDRINVAMHPLVRPFGLAGRDVVRIAMGFGCNVPAVISTRSCSSCSRGTCISAIAFGAACSYQLPATLAVLSGSGHGWLVGPFLLYLLATTLVYLRLVSPREARSPLNQLMIERRSFLAWPRWPALWREARGTIVHFFLRALPIFFAISLAASLLAWAGALGWMVKVVAPVMSLFNLPGEAALPIIMAAIRKDGILLFLAGGDGGELAVPMSALQVLTGVYLAGVLVPCLVTAWTIAREQSWRFAGWLLLKQATAAVLFTLALAWVGRWLSG